MSKQRIKHLIAVLLAFGSMLYFYLKHQLVLTGGHELILKVEGYDPRDLLSGYYLRYRVAYGMDICQEYGQNPVCICFGPRQGVAHQVDPAPSCNMAQMSCNIFIKGRCDGHRFKAGIERYYIPENKRHFVPVIPPNATIRVKVDPNGKAVTEAFYINDETLEDYLERRSQEAKPIP